MNLDRVERVVGATPHMTPELGHKIAKFIADHDVHDVLELGFFHGVSTCYMAAALQDTPGATITTVDTVAVRGLTPTVEQQLDELGLRHLVEVHYEPTSYIWRLMRMIQEDPTPRFDLCYLDGAHDWFTDGFAFVLADKLLRPGGWVIFDDIDWTFGSSSLSQTDRVRRMPDDERNTPHVRLIYELLVKQHKGYDSFSVERDWAFARKRPESQARSGPQQVVTEVVHEKYGLGAFLENNIRRIRRRLGR